MGVTQSSDGLCLLNDLTYEEFEQTRDFIRTLRESRIDQATSLKQSSPSLAPRPSTPTTPTTDSSASPVLTPQTSSSASAVSSDDVSEFSLISPPVSPITALQTPAPVLKTLTLNKKLTDTKLVSSATVLAKSMPVRSAKPTQLVIPRALESYIRAGNDNTNKQIKWICTPGFAINNKDFVIDDGLRSGIKPAITYAFLVAVHGTAATTSSRNGGYSPKFVEIKLNNALVNKSKELYDDIWRLIPNKQYPTASTGFLKANMTRDQTEAVLKKRPAILVATPGKFMDLLEHNKVSLDQTVRICFDPLNALLIYNYHDVPIQVTLEELKSNNRIIALTTSLSEALHMRFKNLTSSHFSRNLKDMIHFSNDGSARLQWLLKHLELVPTNDRKVDVYPPDKTVHALKCLMDPETKQAQFGDRPILAICNLKTTVRRLRLDVKTMFEKELPIFHAGEDLSDGVRWANLAQFEELDSDVLACTRRSMYGCQFEFLPAFLVVEFPHSGDEWLYIVQWYLSLCEQNGVGPPVTYEPSSLPKIKFLYEVDKDDERIRLNRVLSELRNQGINIEPPHKQRPEHRNC